MSVRKISMFLLFMTLLVFSGQNAPAAAKTWTSPVLFIHGDDDRNVAFSQTGWRPIMPPSNSWRDF